MMNWPPAKRAPREDCRSHELSQYFYTVSLPRWLTRYFGASLAIIFDFEKLSLVPVGCYSGNVYIKDITPNSAALPRRRMGQSFACTTN